MRAIAICFAAVATLFAWVGSIQAQEKSQSPSILPALSNEDAWLLLPRKNPSLPAWARILARPLPKTTGALLELDYLHRARNPLEPALAAKLRWMAAHTLGCEYGRRYAEADLRRAGLGADDLKKLAGDAGKLPIEEHAALTFTRKMSRDASTVTDDEMAELLKLFGPEKTVALVHTVAYANFHNRIVMALGVEVEPDGPLPPVDLRLDPAQRAKIIAPPRTPLKELPDSTPSLPGFRLDWGKQSSDDLTKALDQQKGRKSRIPLPDPGRFAKMPPPVRNQAERIVWMTVSMGYQPRLTAAWFECRQAFQSEAAFDRVFSNSVFWVITRSNQCFY